MPRLRAQSRAGIREISRSLWRRAVARIERPYKMPRSDRRGLSGTWGLGGMPGPPLLFRDAGQQMKAPLRDGALHAVLAGAVDAAPLVPLRAKLSMASRASRGGANERLRRGDRGRVCDRDPSREWSRL